MLKVNLLGYGYVEDPIKHDNKNQVSSASFYKGCMLSNIDKSA